MTPLYCPLLELPSRSFEEYFDWLQASKEDQLQLLNDPDIGADLTKFAYRARTSESDPAGKPWYRGVAKHPHQDGYIGDFAKRFPDLVVALNSLGMEYMYVTMQLTPGSLHTVESQHYDANYGEDYSMRAYLVLDERPRLFWRKLKPAYRSLYANTRGKSRTVPEHHCESGRHYSPTLHRPHFWAISNELPHGFDFDGNTGRVSLVINGKIDPQRLKELMDKGRADFPNNVLYMESL